MFGAINADTISDSTPPTWAGFFFCLASAEGAGLLFCPYTIHPHTSIYSAFCVVHAVIPPTPQNSTQGFAKAFPVICPTPAHAIQQEHKPPIRRLCSAGGHTVKRCTSTNTQIPAPRRTLYSSKQLPIIIRYIRVQRCAPVMNPCQTVQHSADHASPAGFWCFPRPAACGLALGQRSERTRPALRPPPGGAVQWQGRGGRRGTIGGLSPHLFSGFRPIANRGQQ